jgi:predicted permease
VPMGYIHDGCLAAAEGDVPSSDEPRSDVGCNTVSAEYFAALRIPIVKGRQFAEQDDPDSAKVVIVNETLAQRLWPGADPIGKKMVVPRFEGRVWEVVGVARDSKYLAVFENPLPHVYFSMRQTPSFMRVIYLRSAVPPAALATIVEREIQRLDPDMPVADLRTMTQIVQGGMGFLLFRIGTLQAGAMGMLGLLLAVVGVYGVVSYGASQRTREMGIRIALGAEPSSVRTLVLRQGSTLVIAGITGGLLIAAAVTRALSRFFFLVGSTDLPTFAVVTLLLSAIAMIACYLPARRAMRVDPMIALRHE